MKISKISRIYTKLYLSKSSLISLFISFIILLVSISYQIYINSSSYIMFPKIVENNYLDLSLNLLNISLIFIIIFLLLRETSLLQDSFDTLMESIIGRRYIFITKEITLVSIIIIISTIFYLATFIPIYFVYRFFKFDFILSYINYILYLIEISQLILVINYLFKNHFVSLMLGIFIIIKESINIPFIDYIIPTIIIDRGFSFNLNIYYIIGYILILFNINYMLYVKLDRK